MVLFRAFVSAGVILIAYDGKSGDAGLWHSAYALVTDFWLVAVIPLALYPIWRGKVWCRYWCPLAKYREILSRWYGRLTITSHDKCIQYIQYIQYSKYG